ncbi:MAG: hypothetical protein R2867_32655 [Caldilineaceae bacterium]
MTGLSEFIAPWGMSAICENRDARIWRLESCNRSVPPESTRPDSIRAGGFNMRKSASTVVDLPDPDSPTNPSRSPFCNEKETSSTARTGPVWV